MREAYVHANQWGIAVDVDVAFAVDVAAVAFVVAAAVSQNLGNRNLRFLCRTSVSETTAFHIPRIASVTRCQNRCGEPLKLVRNSNSNNNNSTRDMDRLHELSPRYSATYTNNG